MRWSIRYQLLLPLIILLLGVVGISTWTGIASARAAWLQIETDLRNVNRTLSEATWPLNAHVLGWMKGLSGADYHLVDDRHLVHSDNDQYPTTLPTMPADLPAVETVVEDWRNLHLGPRITVAGQVYFCSGVRLRSGSTLYILFPERLWRDALWAAIRPVLRFDRCLPARRGGWKQR